MGAGVLCIVNQDESCKSTCVEISRCCWQRHLCLLKRLVVNPRRNIHKNAAFAPRSPRAMLALPLYRFATSSSPIMALELEEVKRSAEKFNCQEVADETRVEDQFVLMAGNHELHSLHQHQAI